MNIPHEIIEAAQGLHNPTARGLFYTATIEYLYDGIEPDYKMGREVQSLFTLAKPLLDAYKAQNPYKAQNQ